MFTGIPERLSSAWFPRLTSTSFPLIKVRRAGVTGKGTFLSDSYSERFRDSGSCTSTQRLPSGSSLYFTGRSINCTRVPTGTVSNRYLMSSFRKRIHPGLPADQYRNWHLSREWHKACRYKLHTGPSDFLARQEQMLASFPRERRIRVGYLASVSSLVLPAYALPPSPSCAAFLYPPDQCQWVKPQPYCCQQDNSKAASRRR